MTTHDQCSECGYDWRLSQEAAIELVRVSPDRNEHALRASEHRAPIRAGLWSPLAYLWHMVDVLRLGTERLWTLTYDPEVGGPAWDESDLAQVRQYEALSPLAGLEAYRLAAQVWTAAAGAVPPSAKTPHPEIGLIDALYVIRRNAHEVQHHLMDIEGQD